MLARSALLLALLTPLTACSDPVEGFEWDITLTGEVDLCNADPSPFQQVFRYRLTFEGSKSTLHIGPDAFATGTIAGCRIDYRSVVWGEEKGGFEYRWVIDGSAFYRQASGCDAQLPDNVDWQGTEIYTILETTNPDIPPNCTYELSAEGVYVGPASR
jgi:hypothetical protein